MRNEKKSVEVTVNGEKVFLNRFLQNMVEGLAIAIVDPLKREKEEEIREVMIKVNRA